MHKRSMANQRALMTVVIGLAVAARPGVLGLSCFFDTNNNTHITDLPHTLSCKCDSEADTFVLGGGETILQSGLSTTLVSLVNTVSISNCDFLVLNLTKQEDALEVFLEQISIVIVNSEQVNFILDSTKASEVLDQIFMSNVSHSEILFVEEAGYCSAEGATLILGLPSQEFYFYLSITLGALCVLLAGCLLFLGIWTCTGAAGKKRKSGSSGCCGSGGRTGKKVSRAASWRYESNFLVNPTQRQQQLIQQRQQPSQQEPPHSPTHALQQMLPYHLVSQPQAALVSPTLAETYQAASNTQNQSQPLLQSRTPESTSERYPLTMSSNHSHFFVEQDLSETELSASNAATEERNRRVSSNANTGSYCSRNQNSTLQLQS